MSVTTYKFNQSSLTGFFQENRVFLGMCAALLTCFLFSIMNGFVKALSAHHAIVELAFYRNLIGILLLTMFLGGTSKWALLKTKRPFVHVIRGTIGTMGLLMTFAAFAILPMSEATVLLFAQTLLIPVLSIFFLREKIGKHRWSAIMVGFVGVLVIANPNLGGLPMPGVACALIGAFFCAVVGVFLRWIGRTEDPMAVTFYFALSGIIITGVAMPFFYTPLQPGEIWLLLGMGVTGILGQYMLSASYRLAPASVVAPFNYFSLIWASMIDMLIWQHVPGWPVFLGGTVIIGANLFIIWRESFLRRNGRKDVRPEPASVARPSLSLSSAPAVSKIVTGV